MSVDDRPDRPAHPDDLLSAHVDDELDGETEAWVVDHLAACDPCRRAEAEIVEARSLLRRLPAVDASPVVEGFLARHRRAVRLGAGFVGAAALGLALLGGTSATTRRALVPDVGALRAAHEQGAPGDAGDMQRRTTAAYAAPPGLIGSAVALSRHEMWDGTDLAATVYRDGDIDVSVYQQPGRLDREALPPGEVVAIGDRDVWFGPGEPVVAVSEQGDLVVTVVSDDRAAVLTAVAGLPEWRRRATWDRLHDACQRLVQAFALDG